MDIKKIAPWNWFKDEESTHSGNLPINRTEPGYQAPMAQLHEEVERLFDRLLDSFGRHNPPNPDTPSTLAGRGMLLRPNVDIATTADAYSITVEAPGVDEENIHLELVDNALTIRGEKKLQAESQEAEFYRIERRYGAFQRVLSLPEDTDCDNIDAQFSNGVLTITLPRKALPKSRGKVIDIRRVA